MRINLEFNTENERLTAELSGWRWSSDEVMNLIGEVKSRFFAPDRKVRIKVSTRVARVIITMEGYSSRRRFARALPPRKP